MKRIQKGFTLVELIVVMAIMGIIMTVIMSIINPTSRIASKVESMKDEETAAISVGRAIKSELEFATKVYVVGANDGETISGVPSDFSYVYVINNSEARPNSRKGAKGIVTLGSWDGTSISNEVVVMQESSWFEDEYQIGIDEYNTTPGNYYIQIGFRGYRMIVESGGYVMDPSTVYKYSEAINFVNINNRDEIKKGGNTGAANFTCEILGDTIRPAAGKAYKDKIYIFFKPANETALSVGGGMLYTTSYDPSVTTAGGGGTTAGGGGTTAGTTAASKGKVTFNNSDGSILVLDLSSSGLLPYLPTDSPAAMYTNPSNEFEYTMVGWFTSSNPVDLTKKVTASTVFAGNTTLYPYYQKIDKHEVKFLDFDGNVFETQYVLDGEAAAAPATNPTPPDASKVFDRWVDGSGNSLGLPITANVTYSPTMTAAKGLMYIHFLTDYNNGRLVVKESSDFTIDGTQYKDYKEVSGIYKKPGDVITVKCNSGSANACIYYENSWNEMANFTVNSTHGERHVYYYLDNTGKLGMSSDNEPVINHSHVTFRIRPGNEPSNGQVVISNFDSGAYAKIQIDPNGVTYFNTEPISLNVTDNMTLVLSTNIKVKANNTAVYNVSNNGSDYTLYLYTDLNGEYVVSTNPWTDYSKLTVHFLENTEGNLIALTNGSYFYNGNTVSGSSGDGWNYFFNGNTYGAGADLQFKYLQDSTLYINGTQYTLGNDGGSHEVTYYNGNFYNNAADAIAQYEIDHAGEPSLFDGTINIHYAKSKQKNYGNGEFEKFYRLNGQPNWNDNAGDTYINLTDGQSLKVEIVSAWNQVKNTKEFTYNELKSSLIRDIWIMEGEIYTSKPSGFPS